MAKRGRQKHHNVGQVVTFLSAQKGGLLTLNSFVVYLRVNCILSLITALHPCLIYKTED